MIKPPLSHITKVGKTKAIGLLSFPEIRAHGVEPQYLAQKFNTQSHAIRILKTGEMLWDETLTENRQTIAVAHLAKLQKILDANKELLQRVQWPDDARSFFERSLKDYVLRGTPDHDALQDIIKHAYGYSEKPAGFMRCVSRALKSVF